MQEFVDELDHIQEENCALSFEPDESACGSKNLHSSISGLVF